MQTQSTHSWEDTHTDGAGARRKDSSTTILSNAHHRPQNKDKKDETKEKTIFFDHKMEHLLVGSVSYDRDRRTEKANSHGINNKSGQNHYSMKAEK